MNPQIIRDAAQRFIGQLDRLEHGEEGAAGALAALFADDARLSNPIIEREGGERVGREAIAAFWQAYRGNFSDIHSAFFDLTAGEQSAGLFWRSEGAGRDGQPLAYEGVTLLQFDEGGRITRFKGYFDPDQVRLKVTRH
ncbi:MAG: nuclear transport factor 2 family protein [Massilia sp.]